MWMLIVWRIVVLCPVCHQNHLTFHVWMCYYYLLLARNFGACSYDHLWRFWGLPSTILKFEVMNASDFFIGCCILLELACFFKEWCFNFLTFFFWSSADFMTRLMTVGWLWKLFLDVIGRVLGLINAISWSYITRLLLRIVGHLVLREIVWSRLYIVLLFHKFRRFCCLTFDIWSLLLFNDCSLKLFHRFLFPCEDLFW